MRMLSDRNRKMRQFVSDWIIKRLGTGTYLPYYIILKNLIIDNLNLF